MSGESALAFGLVDKIIEKRETPGSEEKKEDGSKKK